MDTQKLLNILEQVIKDFPHLHFGFWLPLAENRLTKHNSTLID